jgi:hypothetical protein
LTNEGSEIGEMTPGQAAAEPEQGDFHRWQR